ncbi:MAG: ABC transporter ATP-binding protein [Lachnospiraceae bacterium]|nr:ABC transporter ATP-binding protein [Lachnospiraceae bacterium]
MEKGTIKTSEREDLLRAEHLKKVFVSKKRGNFTAVNNISFSISRGQAFSIVGESGSGKTTLVRMLTRLADPTEGRIFLDGCDITDLSGRDLKPVHRKMQMVFQDPQGSFDPRQTLGAGIEEVIRNFGFPEGYEGDRSRKALKVYARERCIGLLQRLGLSGDFRDRYPHEVSGGQCQRAAIARALAAEPELLILDEATSALDVTVQKDVMDLVTELQKETGIAILMITHDIALASRYSDRLLVMYHGKIVEEGQTEDVIRSPKDAYTRQLMDSVF